MSVLLYVAIGLLAVYYLFGLGSKKGKPLPGPKGWPLIGVGIELKRQGMMLQLSEYARKYGDIVKLNVFGRSIVVLNSAEMIRKAFTADPSKKFMNDRVKTFLGETVMFGSQGIGMLERAHGSIHGDLRKGFTRAMRWYGEGKPEFENMVQSEISKMIDKIESHDGKEFNFLGLAKQSIENIISIILSGQGLDTDEDFKKIWNFDRHFPFFLNSGVDTILKMFPFIKHIPSTYKTRYDELIAARDALIKMFFEDAKATYTPGVIRGMVDFMIKEQRESVRSGNQILYTDERIMAQCLESLVAGVVTTLVHMNSVFLLLMKHPEYQTNIQKELDRVVGRDRLPTLADRTQCHMIEAVSLETHRYIPSLPGAVSHACNSNIEFEGFDIPKNSTVIPNIFYVHHDEKVWGDPWVFRPERFLDDNGEVIPHDHPLRKNWLAFGTGRRQCVGESLARSRVFLFVSTLLQRWTFQLPRNCHVSCDPRDIMKCRDIALAVYKCQVIPRDTE